MSARQLLSRRSVAAATALVVLYVGLALLGLVPGGWRLSVLLLGADQVAEAEREHHRGERLAQFSREWPEPGGVVFVGSSTVEGLDLGRHFPGALNRGIGDEPLAGLEARLARTLDDLAPRVVVLYAASVDARRPTGDGGWRDVAELAEGVRRVVARVLASPGIERVALVEVLPETHPRPPVARRVEELGRALAAVAAAAGPRVVFVETRRPPLVDPATGLLDPAMARDRLHLNERGYGVLAGWLRAAVPELAP